MAFILTRIENRDVMLTFTRLHDELTLEQVEERLGPGHYAPAPQWLRDLAVAWFCSDVAFAAIMALPQPADD